MVREGIVLGHKISKKGIEVDKAKIEVIEQLPPPTNVNEIHSSGICRFFSKIHSEFLAKVASFVFMEDCLQLFHTLKEGTRFCTYYTAS
jgi:hypothetical protein